MDAIRQISQYYRQATPEPGSPDTATAPLIPSTAGRPADVGGAASMRNRIQSLLGGNRPITRLLSSYGLATPALKRFSDAQVDTLRAALAFLAPVPTNNAHATGQHIVNACTIGTAHQFSAVLKLIEESIIDPHRVGPMRAHLLCEMAARGSPPAESDGLSLEMRVVLLLQHGANQYHCNQRGELPLEVAWSGHTEASAAVGMALVSAGFDPRICDHQGTTVAHRAAQEGNVGLLGHWCAAGLPVDMRDNLRRTPLVCAAEAERGDSVELLLTHPQPCIDAADNDGFTALHFAAVSRNAHIVAKLLAGGADPDVQTVCLRTPYQLACKTADRFNDRRIVDLMLQAADARER